ncbi:hypothetical protein Tco_1009285 [Tanacetum coccineum]
MEELLQIRIEGLKDAIVVPAVLANEFELKIELLDFISNNPFFGPENDDPHSHIRRFYQITRTLKINQVPHDVEQEAETITEVVEIPSSQSTPLVPSLTDAFFALDDSIPPDIDNGIYDSEGDILFLEKLLEDEPSKAKKSEINPIIREPSDTFLMGDMEIKFNPLKDIDDLVPISKVSEKPLDSLDCISETFDMTITNPLFDFDSEFTLNSDNPVFVIQNEESDEFEAETITEEVQIHSSQSTAQVPPPYGKLTFDLTMPKPILTFSHFRHGIFGKSSMHSAAGKGLSLRVSSKRSRSEVAGFAGRLANKEATRGNNDEVSEGSVRGSEVRPRLQEMRDPRRAAVIRGFGRTRVSQ